MFEDFDFRAHLRHLRRAENRGESDIRGVAAGADARYLVARCQVGGIEQIPAPAEESLEHRVEIGRWVRKIGVACDESRRDIERPAEGDGEMREIPADPGALDQDIRSRGIGIRAANLVLDVLSWN